MNFKFTQPSLEIKKIVRFQNSVNCFLLNPSIMESVSKMFKSNKSYLSIISQKITEIFNTNTVQEEVDIKQLFWI